MDAGFTISTNIPVLTVRFYTEQYESTCFLFLNLMSISRVSKLKQL